MVAFERYVLHRIPIIEGESVSLAKRHAFSSAIGDCHCPQPYRSKATMTGSRPSMAL